MGEQSEWICEMRGERFRVAAAAFSGVKGTVCKYVKNVEHICNEAEFISANWGGTTN